MRDFKKQLKDWEKKNSKKPKQKKKPQQKKKRDEKLSEHDLKELMGMNQKTYHRGHGGAFRQR